MSSFCRRHMATLSYSNKSEGEANESWDGKSQMRQARRCRGRYTHAALHTTCTSHTSPPVHYLGMKQNFSILQAKGLQTLNSLWEWKRFWQCNIAHKTVAMYIMEEHKASNVFSKRKRGHSSLGSVTQLFSLSHCKVIDGQWSLQCETKR